MAGGAAVALSLAVVATLGLRYHGAPTPGRFDTIVDEWTVAQVGGDRSLASRVSMLGAVHVVVAVSLIAATWLAWRYRARAAAALVVLAPLATTVVAQWLLKPWVGRTLDGDLSFPSGHTSRVSALVVAVVLTMHSIGVSRRVLAIVGVAGIVVIAMVAWSMVAARYHYATDTLAGVLFGSAVALIGALAPSAVRLIIARRSP